MKQRLYFEEKWDKTLSEKDRDYIKQIFHDTSAYTRKIEFITLWLARNHNNALLATVLIHNRSSENITFLEKKLSFSANEQTIASHTFSYPTLIIKPYTSMPWTFIFPAETIKSDRDVDTGTLCLL